jgi:hypothetical protein
MSAIFRFVLLGPEFVSKPIFLGTVHPYTNMPENSTANSITRKIQAATFTTEQSTDVWSAMRKDLNA